MQIQTVCPQCGKRYAVDERYEGARVQCEHCGRQFAVARASVKREGCGKDKLSFFSCFVIWLVFFAIQGCGYLLAIFINMGIDAYLIEQMLDYSIRHDILKVSIILLLTSMTSYCAFSAIVVKMMTRRLKGE